jgi:hypothetical protein
VRLDRASAVLRWQVASTGILLHANPTWEWTRFRAREASDHADLEEATARYARLYLQRLARPR